MGDLLRNCPYVLWLDNTEVEVARLVSHVSEYQMRELFLLFFGQYVYPTGSPHAYEVIYELSACEPVLLQEQFDHTLTLLLNLFVSFAHNYAH